MNFLLNPISKLRDRLVRLLTTPLFQSPPAPQSANPARQQQQATPSLDALRTLLTSRTAHNRFSIARNTYVTDEAFAVQDRQKRRAAIETLAQIESPEAHEILRDLLADLESTSIYSPDRDMKLSEIALLRQVLARSEALIVDCPFCKRKITVTPELRGKEVNCPKCRKFVALPRENSPQQWAELLAQAGQLNDLAEFAGILFNERDPWHFEKRDAAKRTLVQHGELSVRPIIEALIRSKQRAYFSENLTEVLVQIGAPSTAPYVKTVIESGDLKSASSTTLVAAKEFLHKHSDHPPFDEALLMRLKQSGSDTEEVQTPELIRCCCGASTTLTYDGSRYVAANACWRFGDNGWTCGAPGHVQG